MVVAGDWDNESDEKVIESVTLTFDFFELQQQPVASGSNTRGLGVAWARRRARRCRLVGPGGESIPIPNGIFGLIERMAELLTRGDALTIVPVGQDLTTQQAPDILNVSRQYLVRLLDPSEIPFTRAGTHRRLGVGDALTHKERRHRWRRAALDELTSLSQEAGDYVAPVLD